MNDETSNTMRGAGRGRWKRRVAQALVIGMGAATLAACGTPGWGGDRGGSGDWGRGGPGPGMRQHAPGGPGGPGQFDARGMSRMLDRMLSRLDATPEQRSKVQAIAAAAQADLAPLHQRIGEARRKATELLTQPSVDRAALEALRADQTAVVDQISRRMTQALADVADVLTPEQRAKAREMLERRGRRGGPGGRGPGGPDAGATGAPVAPVNPGNPEARPAR